MSAHLPEAALSTTASGGGNPMASTPTTEKSKVDAMKTALEAAGKLLLGLAGLCYVLGLIVVSIHFGPYHLNNLDLPQLQYAIAGMWAVLPILLAIMSVIFLLYVGAAIRETNQGTAKRGFRWGDTLAIVIFVPVVLYLVFRFLINSVGIEFGLFNWIGLPLLGTLAALIASLALYGLAKFAKQDKFSTILLASGTLVFASMLFLVYVLQFAKRTYPTIPISFGGGRPSTVQLFVAPDAKPYLEDLKVSLSPDQSNKEMVKSDSIKLLITTEKVLVVLNRDGKAVTVPREAVKWVLYEK